MIRTLGRLIRGGDLRRQSHRAQKQGCREHGPDRLHAGYVSTESTEFTARSQGVCRGAADGHSLSQRTSFTPKRRLLSAHSTRWRELQTPLAVNPDGITLHLGSNSSRSAWSAALPSAAV